LKLSLMAMISSNIQMDLFLRRQKRSSPLQHLRRRLRRKRPPPLHHFRTALYMVLSSPLSLMKWPPWCLKPRPRMISGSFSKTPMPKHLAAISSNMTDYVLHGLDDGYRAIIDAVNARDTPINFDDLHERLLIQELSIGVAQRQTPAPLTALNAQARPNSNDKSRHGQNPAQSTQRTGTRKPFLGRCQWCNIKGHVLSQCKTFQQQHPSVPPPPRNSPAHTGQVQVNTATAGPSQHDFLFDSGATHHVTNDLDNLALHHPYTGPDSLFMGNGSGLNITHSGTLLLNDLSLSNALCVPSMKQKIISVSKLTQQTNSAVVFLPNSFYAHVWMDSISGPPPHPPSTRFEQNPLHHGIIGLGTLHLLFSNLFRNIFP
ncbi:hypothetical protein glysoja_037893, partial [Glycine soja]